MDQMERQQMRMGKEAKNGLKCAMQSERTRQKKTKNKKTEKFNWLLCRTT